METVGELKVERFPYIQLIIISALIGFIGTVWLHIMPSGLYNFYNLGYALCVMYFMVAPMVLLLIAMPLSKTKSIGKYLTPVNLTYLYAVGFMASWFVNADNLYNWLMEDIVMTRVFVPVDSLRVFPWFAAPPEEIARGLINGGGVSWGAWTPTIVFWWLYEVVFGIFWFSLASILRKRWVDTEKIPFVHTLIAAELVVRTGTPEVAPKKRLGRPFIIGLLIGIATQVPIFMTSIFPWFPDIYGWKVNTCPTGGQYISSNSPLAGIAGFSIFQKHPLAFAVAYLVPVGVLQSTAIWYLIYVIAVQVAVNFGFYTGLTGMGGCGRAWCAPGEPQEGPPLYFYSLSFRGGLIGLSVISLFLSRRYILDTFRAIHARRAHRTKMRP